MSANRNQVVVKIGVGKVVARLFGRLGIEHDTTILYLVFDALFFEQTLEHIVDALLVGFNAYAHVVVDKLLAVRHL